MTKTNLTIKINIKSINRFDINRLFGFPNNVKGTETFKALPFNLMKDIILCEDEYFFQSVQQEKLKAAQANASPLSSFKKRCLVPPTLWWPKLFGTWSVGLVQKSSPKYVRWRITSKSYHCKTIVSVQSHCGTLALYRSRKQIAFKRVGKAGETWQGFPNQVRVVTHLGTLLELTW